MPARRRACDSCFTRKIQCVTADIGDPCNWCQHHNLACTFDRPSRRSNSSRAKRKAQETLDIAKRLELIEANIARVRELHDQTKVNTVREPILIPPSATNSDSASPTPGYSLADSNNPQGQFYFFSHNFGTLCSPTGLPQFTSRCKRWIHAATGEWPNFGESAEHETVILPSPSRPLNTTIEEVALPELQTLEALVDTFLRSDFSRCFPFIDGSLFEETIRLAYTSSPFGDTDSPASTRWTRASISARACVFVFSTIASSKFPECPGAENIDWEACTSQAERLLIHISGDASLSTLQTTLMLMVWKAHAGNVAGGAVYHAVACRIVFALGGHTRVPTLPGDRGLNMQERHDHHLRSLFWLCYIFDKEAALRTAQPPIVGDEYCDLTLPDGYLEHVYGARRQNSYDPDDLPMPWLISDIRLVKIKSRAAKELYSFASAKKSDAELLSTIRELDEELERWRLSIPADFAPSLAIRRGAKLSEHLAQSENMLQIELHLAYHHLLSIVHCASGRCSGDQSGEMSETNFGLQSSLDLSVEASRSTLIFLSLAVHRLAGEAFWIFNFYPVSAFVSLFFNLLRNPRNEYAELDLDLIRTTSEVIRQMPKSGSTQTKAAYLDRIDRFGEEVTRLAECAVARSREEYGPSDVMEYDI